MRENRKLRIFYIVCALAVAIFIFAFSAQQGETSGNTSEAASSALVNILKPFLNKLSDLELNEIIYNFNVVLRKLAHAFIYALLGYFCASFALTWHGNFALLAISGWLAAVVYAASDELHQMFVPGRGPSLLDVALDGSGAALGASVAALVFVLAGIANEKSKK